MAKKADKFLELGREITVLAQKFQETNDAKFFDKATDLIKELNKIKRPNAAYLTYRLGHAFSPNEKFRIVIPFRQWLFENKENIAFLDMKPVELLTEDEKKLLPQYEEAKKEWSVIHFKSVERFNKEKERLFQQFRKEVEDEFGMTNHPKRDLLWELANNTQSRPHEVHIVYRRYSDMMDLLIALEA